MAQVLFNLMPKNHEMTQSKSLKTAVELIKALREGPVKSAKLLEQVKASRRTFYRVLSALKDAGVAKEIDGYYYWYEHLDVEKYSSDFEAKQALNHSVTVAAGLQYMLPCTGRYYVEGKPEADREYVSYALAHLKTGYLEFYEVSKKTEEIRKRMVDGENQFIEKVKQRILSTQLKLLEDTKEVTAENLGKNICEDIKESLRGRKPRNLESLRIEEDLVYSGLYKLSGKEEFDSIKRLTEAEEASKKHVEDCRRIVELENEYYIQMKHFEKSVKTLIMKVLNGTPLKGKCDLCPKLETYSTQLRRQEG
jgi:predicted transcriptional regulator